MAIDECKSRRQQKIYADGDLPAYNDLHLLAFFWLPKLALFMHRLILGKALPVKLSRAGLYLQHNSPSPGASIAT